MFTEIKCNVLQKKQRLELEDYTLKSVGVDDTNAEEIKQQWRETQQK